MGTSINQASPRTPNWRAVGAAYTNEAIDIDRAVQEVWRAAANQPSGDLTRDLASPIIHECFRIATTSATREEAQQKAAMAVALSGRASLAADIAQRAVVKSFRVADRQAGFVGALFAESGDYLVSRDLPGYIGTGGRARNVSDAIALKNEIRTVISERVARVARPPDLAGAPQAWTGYVADVIRALKGAG